jgi:predicted transcriptional regulator
MIAQKEANKMGVPRNYRSIEEFEREELRPSFKVGFTLEDLMQETHVEGGDMLFDDTYDAYDPDEKEMQD